MIVNMYVTARGFIPFTWTQDMQFQEQVGYSYSKLRPNVDLQCPEMGCKVEGQRQQYRNPN